MDLSSLITSRDFKKTTNPDQVRFNCPFCNNEKYKFYVNFKKRVYICHRCGVAGSLKQHIPLTVSHFEEKVEEFKNGKTLQDSDQTRIVLPDEIITPVSKSSGIPYNYLRKRQVGESEIKRYKIGYCSEGRYMERVIVPCYENERLVYFVARTYTHREPKYINVGSGRGRIIFRTFTGKVKRAVICEGVFDAIRVGTVFPAIALLGKVLSDAQAHKIKECCNEAIVMLDSDAKVNTFKVTCQLSYYMKARAQYIPAKDPGSMEPKTIKQLLKGEL